MYLSVSAAVVYMCNIKASHMQSKHWRISRDSSASVVNGHLEPLKKQHNTITVLVLKALNVKRKK